MPTQHDADNRAANLGALVRDERAAAILDCTPGHLRNLRTKGGGPRFVKLGRSVRYRLSDLEAFLDAQTFASTSDYEAA